MQANQYMQKFIVLYLGLQLIACANSPKVSNLHRQAGLIKPYQTSKHQISETLGVPTEQYIENDTEVWIYADKLEMPALVSLIPIVGDIADFAEMTHTDRELIIQFDQNGIVSKSKVRDLE